MALTDWIPSNLRGTLQSLFRLGKPSDATSIQIKNNAGALEARNSTDAAFVIGRGLDPVTANDWVTLGYLNANPVEGALLQNSFTVTFGAAGTVDSVEQIPANAYIDRIKVEVTTVFDGGATLTVGNTATAALLAATTDIDLATTGIYMFPINNSSPLIWSILSVVRATRGGVSTVGLARVTVFYTVDPKD